MPDDFKSEDPQRSTQGSDLEQQAKDENRYVQVNLPSDLSNTSTVLPHAAAPEVPGLDWHSLNSFYRFRREGGDDSSLNHDTKTVSESKPLAAFREAAQTFTRSHRKLVLTRQDALLHRGSAAYKWDGYKHTLGFVRKANKDFVSECTKFVEHAGSQQAVTCLSRLNEQVAKDDDAFNARVEELLESQRELSNAEFYMQRKEEILHEAALAMLKAIGQLGLVPASELEDLAESKGTTLQSHSLRATSPGLHPLLELYFDKAGDVNVYRDRLAELQSDHAQARTTRMVQQDQEQVLDVSDEDFELSFLHVETQSHAIIEKAIEEREAARLDCLAHGLDPDDYKQAALAQDLDLQQTEEEDQAALPETPSSFDPEPVQQFSGSLAVPSNPFGPRNESSTLMSTETGPLINDIAPLRKRKREKQRVDERVEDWLLNNENKTTVIAGDIDELCTPSKLPSTVTPARSVPDLRQTFLNTTEVQQIMAQSGSQPQLNQSNSEPIVPRVPPISSPSLRPRSQSTSDADQSSHRHDSFRSEIRQKPP